MGKVPRRRFLIGAGALIASARGAAGQQPRSPRRIGFLSPGTPEQRRDWVEAFRQGLREHGRVEGVDVVVEYRWSGGAIDRLPELAAELAALPVEIIVAATTPGALAAKRAAGVIPVVMINAGDPLGSGLVGNLARPDGNVTGLSMLNVELGAKRLGLLKEVMPSLARAFLFWNPGNHGNVLIMQHTESAARTMGIALRSVEVRSPADLDAAFAVAGSGQGNGLIVIEDPVTIEHRKRVADHAAAARLPAIYGLVQYVEAGGLMSYGNRLVDFYRRAAYYVDRILKGARPAELPVEQPTTFEMVINQKAARALPIRLPQSVLLRADRVID